MPVKSKTIIIVTIVYIVLINSFALIGCSGKLFDRGEPRNVVPQQDLTPSAQAGISETRNTPVVKAAQAVGPTVVGITNKAYAQDYFRRRVVVEQGTGSGVIFDTNGYIVTNYHVVQDAQEIVVSLADGRSLPGRIVGTDPATDLAVVKVEATGLPAAAFGDSDSLTVGEPAIVIGNPLGLEFKGSITAGVISALNRSIEIGERKFNLIQTDAAINPGNSGGALVNADGVVVGINSAKLAVQGVEGIAFAIPITTARPIIQSLIEKGKVIRAYLGVGVLDKNSAAQYGYSLNMEKGLFIAKIDPGGPAAKAGLKEGDIIQTIGGSEVNSVADLRSILDAQMVGSKIALGVVRRGTPLTVDVLLEELPAK